MLNDVKFPPIKDDARQRLLALPEGQLRVVIDTDAANEIDDQMTLAWALLSGDQLTIEGLYAAPFSFQHHRQPLLRAYDQLQEGEAENDEPIVYAGTYTAWAEALVAAQTDPRQLPFPDAAEGMALSYDEIVRVVDAMGRAASGLAFRGTPGYLSAMERPLRSPAVDHLIARAMAPDERPLYVVAIGALTNIACALLLEPRIIENIVVVWTAGFPSASPRSNRPSLNLMQDLVASQTLFDSGVSIVYMPGFFIGEQLKISLPDMERWVNGHGEIGTYLHHLYTHNPIHHQRGITDHFGRTWIMWDLINIAWLLNPAWVPTEIVPTPRLDEALHWQVDNGRWPMREATGINRDAIFRDFFTKLAHAYPA